MEALVQWRKHRCEAGLCVSPPCLKGINSILSGLCSGRALQPDSLLLGQQIPTLSFPVPGEGVVTRVLAICWFLSFFPECSFCLGAGAKLMESRVFSFPTVSTHADARLHHQEAFYP